MFDDLKVPTIATVENMSSYECTKCHEVHKPFGPGYLPLLKNQFGIKNSFSIPLFSEISRYSDAGTPTVLILPSQHRVTEIYTQIANGVVSELKVLEKGDLSPPHVRYETGKSLVIVRKNDGKEKKIKVLNWKLYY